jgi:lysyl-tRNA synthetase class 2
LLLRPATLSYPELTPPTLLCNTNEHMSPLEPILYGRCVAIESQTILFRRFTPGTALAETRSVIISNASEIALGDIIEIQNGRAKTLTRNTSGKSGTRWSERTLEPRRLKALKIRQAVESGIRDFFSKQDFLETKTPLLVSSPGMEPHIRPFTVERPKHFGSGSTYLPTSPEFAMKKLLVGGLERIFQICSAFREEPNSITHSPEFTILEWYRAYAGYEQIMEDTEKLFESIAIKLFGKPALSYQGKELSVKTPWPRLKVRDLFMKHAEIDLVRSNSRDALASECKRLGLTFQENESWDDLYFKVWLNLIEPKISVDQAVFVTRYPKSQAALSVVDQDSDGSEWAKRFEVYIGGLELGNAFEELTDPQEQRVRFEKDMQFRHEVYGAEFPKNKIDEEFLGALAEGMPPSGGIAVGVDRMVMLFADESDIDYTLWLKSGDYSLS